MAYEPVSRLSEAQVLDLHRLYQGVWWARERQLPDIRRMLQHCEVVAFCDSESRRLVAFARIVTDYVYKALVLDVIVDESLRGQGLGLALMDAITRHPALAEVRHFELYCRPELVDVYRRWGFTRELGELQFMRLTQPPRRVPA